MVDVKGLRQSVRGPGSSRRLRRLAGQSDREAGQRAAQEGRLPDASGATSTGGEDTVEVREEAGEEFAARFAGEAFVFERDHVVPCGKTADRSVVVQDAEAGAGFRRGRRGGAAPAGRAARAEAKASAAISAPSASSVARLHRGPNRDRVESERACIGRATISLSRPYMHRSDARTDYARRALYARLDGLRAIASWRSSSSTSISAGRRGLLASASSHLSGYLITDILLGQYMRRARSTRPLLARPCPAPAAGALPDAADRDRLGDIFGPPSRTVPQAVVSATLREQLAADRRERSYFAPFAPNSR